MSVRARDAHGRDRVRIKLVGISGGKPGWRKEWMARKLGSLLGRSEFHVVWK